MTHIKKDKKDCYTGIIKILNIYPDLKQIFFSRYVAIQIISKLKNVSIAEGT